MMLSVRRPRLPNEAPIASNSASSQPTPSPRSIRPADMRSTVARERASDSG